MAEDPPAEDPPKYRFDTDESLKALIEEVASKHGVALSPDDPLLIMQTINLHLVSDLVSACQSVLDDFESRIEDVCNRWNTAAEDKANRSLTAALAASKEAMKKVMLEGGAFAAEKMAAALAASASGDKWAKPLKEVKDYTRLVIISACSSIVASAIAIIIVICK